MCFDDLDYDVSTGEADLLKVRISTRLHSAMLCFYSAGLRLTRLYIYLTRLTLFSSDFSRLGRGLSY